MDFARSAARLAAQFSRSGRVFTIEEIATDALKFAKVAATVRRNLITQKCPEKNFAALAPIAERYGAIVVKQGDVDGMAVGLKFRDGSHAAGFRDIFFVS